MNKLTRKNAKIAVAGIYTIGHYRSSQVRVELRLAGGGCGENWFVITKPPKKGEGNV